VPSCPCSLEEWRWQQNEAATWNQCPLFFSAGHRTTKKKFVTPTRGRCCAHYFMRFFPIFGEKIVVFLKYQWYDQLFQNSALFWVKKRRFFRKIFRRKYFKNQNIGPRFKILFTILSIYCPCINTHICNTSGLCNDEIMCRYIYILSRLVYLYIFMLGICRRQKKTELFSTSLFSE
jgi:hypothetical protein